MIINNGMFLKNFIYVFVKVFIILFFDNWKIVINVLIIKLNISVKIFENNVILNLLIKIGL